MTGLDRLRYTLPRRVSLKRRSWIRSLFDRSRNDVVTSASGCIRIVARTLGHDDTPAGGPLPEGLFVGFSAGPRFRTAVTRNRVKRILRESYRLEQFVITQMLPSATVAAMVLYRGTGDPKLESTRADLRTALRNITLKNIKLTEA